VMHNRQGAPETAAAACLLADGRRAWGTSDDPLVARQMCDGEWVGAAVRLDGEGRLHLDS
jgi:acetyl-CoA C-acetyltransferase